MFSCVSVERLIKVFQMLESTKKIIVAAVSADSTIDIGRLDDSLGVLSGDLSIPEKARMNVVGVEPILTRSEVSDLAKISPNRVDFYARRGYLVRVRFPGRMRSSGITLESVRRFLGAR